MLKVYPTFALSLLIVAAFSTYSIKSDYKYERATPSDLGQLLQLINTEAAQNSDTLVILPHKFREMALEKQIEEQRLFVARQGSDILGFTKLFVMENPEEQQDILQNEIRSHAPSAQPVFSGSFDSVSLKLTPNNESAQYGPNSTFIYKGADFTAPYHRGKGINKKLTIQALQIIKQQTTDQVNKKNSTDIVLVYGLVNKIAGKTPGDESDRTSSIIKQFVPFAQEVAEEYSYTDHSPIEHYRYRAFKPSFDPKAQECIPLPDEHSVEGVGCVLRYPFLKETK